MREVRRGGPRVGILYETEKTMYGGFSGPIKAGVTDMRYFARSTLSRSLVHKKKFGLILQKVFKLEYLFCQRR